MGSLASHPSRGLEMASRLLEMAFWRQLWTNLSPSWLQVASRWGQVGLRLPQVGTKLDPSWLRLGPKSAPGGSRRLSWRVLGGSRDGPGAKRCSRRPQGCKNGSKSLQNDPELSPKKLQILTPSQVYQNYDLQKLPEAAT